MHKARGLYVVLTLSVVATSCFTRKSPSVFTPPPPQTHPQTPDGLPELPPAPDINSTVAGNEPTEGGFTMPPRVEPPPAPPPATTGRRAARPAAPPATSAPDTPPPPKLGQIFTADQLREYNRTLEESLERVRKALAMVAGKNLSAPQNEIVVRIRTFQKQAEQAREQDLVTAVNLARRADLLAQDLVGRLP